LFLSLSCYVKSKEYDLRIFLLGIIVVSLISNKQPSILIFDSGVGGLSVYKEIKLLLPALNYIYLFDNEAYPYGELPQMTLLTRVEKLIQHMLKLYTIDLVVIACNTASTIVLPSLRQKLSIPVVGVVPAIKPASVIANKAVGLIATPATIKREYTLNLIKEFAIDKPVELLGSTELVDMAENKLRGGKVNINRLEKVLSPLIGKIDVAVLGCTHFPIIKEEISLVLGREVILVDSGEAIAKRVSSLLNFNEHGGEGVDRIYSSATPYQEAALNNALVHLGFEVIETLPNLDA